MCGVDGGWSQFPGEPGQTLIFSPWQLPESFSRRAISLSYYNASLKHNPCAEFGWKGRTRLIEGGERVEKIDIKIRIFSLLEQRSDKHAYFGLWVLNTFYRMNEEHLAIITWKTKAI